MMQQSLHKETATCGLECSCDYYHSNREKPAVPASSWGPGVPSSGHREVRGERSTGIGGTDNGLTVLSTSSLEYEGEEEFWRRGRRRRRRRRKRQWRRRKRRLRRRNRRRRRRRRRNGESQGRSSITRTKAVQVRLKRMTSDSLLNANIISK